MIVVFVIDTSPSMGKPLVDANGAGSSSTSTSSSISSPSSGMSRLDLSKMAVEEVVRGLKKRIHEHNSQLQQAQPQVQEALRNVGLGFAPKDEFLLLSTGRQYMHQPGTAACGAGGRLLVGFGVDHLDIPSMNGSENSNTMEQNQLSGPSSNHGIDSFQRELKRLKATDWEPMSASSQNPQQSGMSPVNKRHTPFPEDGGGAAGLNAALSAGLQMLSRYRLRFKSTENFAMGRLPTPAILNPGGGGSAIHALQPACLVLITDGVCLRSPPSEGGGSLELQPSSFLREFYQEPFRWDQRIFCLGVGGKEGTSSTQFFHPQLRALCELTGGSHMMLRSSGGPLSQFADFLVKLMSPPRPRDLPLADPIQIPSQPNSSIVGSFGTFVNGGPVCTFQSLEPDLDSGGQPPAKHRAMIIYVPHSCVGESGLPSTLDDPGIFQTPVWCIPETFFPNKKLDSLPPRSAQPNLLYSRFPTRLGSKCFEASAVMKALHRLDQLIMANRNFVSQPSSATSQNQARLLKRDVYICEWISVEGKGAKGPKSPQGMEYFPVLVAGSGRPTLSDGEGNYLSIGILHVPPASSTLSSSLSSGVRLSTLTLLPPEPHVLLPLLIRAADAEHRALKKLAGAESKDPGPTKPGSAPTFNLSQNQASAASRNTHLDESWRNEFRAYMFRLPPYYLHGLKRSLRVVLPASAHSLLNTDATEGVLSTQCYSKICMLKIRNAELMAKTANERLERQEMELRRRGIAIVETGRSDNQQQQQLPPKGTQNAPETSRANTFAVKYGQYDPRSPVDSYLAALRNMPAPWRVTTAKGREPKSPISTSVAQKGDPSLTLRRTDVKTIPAIDILGDLPSKCLMAYYETRRRWIFGGSGLATKGLYVEGVHNDGSNVQRCGAKRDVNKESLLSFAGVGVSQLNETTTAKMGDYRERLLWCRAPVVGSGANDSMGVSATTSQNGAPVWSVDDDAMPVTFFDGRTGEFADSVQARVRSRLLVNFGNPYKDKRGDSLIPEEFLSQRPKKGVDEDSTDSLMTPPASPPHDTFSATEGEGEGEAMFAGKPLPKRRSPHRSPSTSDEHDEEKPDAAKRPKLDPDNRVNQARTQNDTSTVTAKVLPPPPSKAERLKDEKSITSHPQPPPPPPRRQAYLPPPPPPPKGPPKRGSLPRSQSLTQPKPPVAINPPPPNKPPAPPLASTAAASQKRPPPPPPPNEVPSAPVKQAPRPLGPAKAPVPPLESKKVPQQPKRTSLPLVAQILQDDGLDLQTPDAKPNVDLPPGWICVWSKSQKRWYFFDTKTNKSVWQWPPP